VNLTTHLHLAPRSKNEWSYTSTFGQQCSNSVFISEIRFYGGGVVDVTSHENLFIGNLCMKCTVGNLLQNFPILLDGVNGFSS